MIRRIVCSASLFIFLMFFYITAFATDYVSYEEIRQECYALLKEDPAAAETRLNEYIKKYPQWPVLLFCLGEVHLHVEAGKGISPTMEASQYFEKAFEADKEIPEHNLGQAFVFYERMRSADDENRLILGKEVLSHVMGFFKGIHFTAESGNLSWNDRRGIIPAVDEYALANMMFFEACMLREDKNDIVAVEYIVEKAMPLLDVSIYDFKISDFAMLCIYRAAQYCELLEMQDEMKMYAQKYLDQYDAILDTLNAVHPESEYTITRLYIRKVRCEEMIGIRTHDDETHPLDDWLRTIFK